MLMIEPERDEDGYHAVVVSVAEDVAVYVTDTFRAVEDAVKAAQNWIALNQ
jgi:hypothetical protein